MHGIRSAALLAVCLLLAPVVAAAQSADNVLVVINSKSPASIQVGEYYARTRHVADDHVVRLETAPTEVIERGDYEQAIETPIAAWLTTHTLQDRILYIVLTKGVPLRVNGTAGLDGTVASVDSELTLLYRKLLGLSPVVAGHVDNPYFLGDRDPSQAKPFTRFTSDIYLVTRLDGFTVDDVLKLVDRAQAPSRDGKIVLDQKANVADRGGDFWLQQASDRFRLSGQGDRVIFETTRAVASTKEPVLGYFSWGSNDPANHLRRFGMTFVNGAIGGLFVSTDGRTFLEPPADWVPSEASRGSRWGMQSLAGDLIRDGITGVSAHVAEPYLDAMIRPQILFPVYLGGMNLAESFYLAMPYLSWQTMVIGDPLCAPFRQNAIAPADLAKPVDDQTELPGLFSERRIALVTKPGYNVDGLKASLRAEVELAKGNRAQSEASLERATELEPRMAGAQIALAEMYEVDGQFDKALDRYRKTLAVDPKNVAALNNLAYALATRSNKPADALPYAQQAFEAAPNPTIADTLAWIQHLLGNDRDAAPLLERAEAGAPDNADILVHAAIVHTAVNDKPSARKELAAADKLDAHLDDRPGVKALRDTLKGGAFSPLH